MTKIDEEEGETEQREDEGFVQEKEDGREGGIVIG